MLDNPRQRNMLSRQNLSKQIKERRPNTITITIAEVFLRRDMGERYFTWRIFLGGLLGMAALRFFVGFYSGYVYHFGYLFPKVRYFDAAIVLYLLLSNVI